MPLMPATLQHAVQLDALRQPPCCAVCCAAPCCVLRTSVRSSMLAGLMSTMLKLWSERSRLHRLMRRSSADRNVSWSLFTEIELMWYVCALANTRLQREASSTSEVLTCGAVQRSTCSAGARSCSQMQLPAATSADEHKAMLIWRHASVASCQKMGVCRDYNMEGYLSSSNDAHACQG